MRERHFIAASVSKIGLFPKSLAEKCDSAHELKFNFLIWDANWKIVLLTTFFKRLTV